MIAVSKILQIYITNRMLPSCIFQVFEFVKWLEEKKQQEVLSRREPTKTKLDSLRENGMRSSKLKQRKAKPPLK